MNGEMGNQGNKKCYGYKGYALLILRLVLGSIFIAHGGQKVLGLFGGPGLEGFLEWIGTFGVSPILGTLAAYFEFIGGLLMFFGVATELGALMTIPVMIGAVLIVHCSNGYFMQNGGFEYPLNLIFLALAVIIGGPGRCALWDPFKCYRK